MMIDATQIRPLLQQVKIAMVQMEKHHRYHHDRDGTKPATDPVIWDGMTALEEALELVS